MSIGSVLTNIPSTYQQHVGAQPADNDGDTDGSSTVRDTPPPAPPASGSSGLPPHRGQKFDFTA